MTSTIDTISADADRALKAKHRAVWALGDYPEVAIEVIPELGPVLVAASGVRAGDRVLDVAAGTGNAAVPAAVAGAEVIACDLTPELFAAGPGVRRPPRCRAASGRRPTRRHCPTRTGRSTSCCPASARCSRRTIRPRPTS